MTAALLASDTAAGSFHLALCTFWALCIFHLSKRGALIVHRPGTRETDSRYKALTLSPGLNFFSSTLFYKPQSDRATSLVRHLTPQPVPGGHSHHTFIHPGMQTWPAQDEHTHISTHTYTQHQQPFLHMLQHGIHHEQMHKLWRHWQQSMQFLQPLLNDCALPCIAPPSLLTTKHGEQFCREHSLSKDQAW